MREARTHSFTKVDIGSGRQTGGVTIFLDRIDAVETANFNHARIWCGGKFFDVAEHINVVSRIVAGEDAGDA